MALGKKGAEKIVLIWILVIAVALIVLIVMGILRGTIQSLWEGISNALRFR
ncbi:hypothetical protein JW968_05370 [Candidatus Woesearchaeota archaeon]|nr:hypothetical protein [Candidatus Woesearchaeota archaeon]